ncbi:thioredoxin domain-containing protein [Williamsia sp. CHRR-6]|nr:thioredoxin domain-containing protein [Williamsia sp. CHRR-6]
MVAEPRSRQAPGYQPRSTSSRAAYILGAAAVAVIVAIVVAVLIRDKGGVKGTADEKILETNAALIIGTPGARHTIDVFEDFSCPACRKFEATNGEAMTAAATRGELRIRFHMLTFLDKRSKSGDYSTRAAAALRCVQVGAGPEKALDYHGTLYRQQPEEGKTDHDNTDLAAKAAAVGADSSVQQCISSGSQVPNAKQSATLAYDQLSIALGGSVATPSVLSAGRSVSDVGDDTAWLTKLLAS